MSRFENFQCLIDQAQDYSISDGILTARLANSVSVGVYPDGSSYSLVVEKGGVVVSAYRAELPEETGYITGLYAGLETILK